MKEKMRAAKLCLITCLFVLTYNFYGPCTPLLDIHTRISATMPRQSKDHKSILDLIESIQRDPTKTSFLYSIKPGDHGIGSQMHMMVSCFSHALHKNHSFAVRGNWIFAGGKPFNHWFRPVLPKNVEKKSRFKTCPKYNTKIKPLKSYAGQGIIWWKGVLENYLMRPNKKLQEKIVEVRSSGLVHVNGGEKTAVSLPAAFIGVQIRHSKTWIYNRINLPLSAFMKAVAHLNATTKSIFLSTENPIVIKNLSAYPGYTFYFTNVPRTNENQARAIKKGRLDGEKDGLNALINLFIMRDAKYFVGGFRSNWGRLVFEHMAAIGNVPRKTIVLDTDKKKIEYTKYTVFDLK
jgi:hypothetical protein